MVFVRILTKLLRDKEIGSLIVPIVTMSKIERDELASLTDAVRSGEFEAVAPQQQHVVNPVEPEMSSGEPVLTADELRALLEEETPMPPAAEGQP